MVLDVVRVNRELRAAFHHMFHGLCERLMKTFALFRCLNEKKIHSFEMYNLFSHSAEKQTKCVIFTYKIYKQKNEKKNYFDTIIGTFLDCNI